MNVNKNKLKPSIETQQEAHGLAKKNKKPGQSKEQTKLIEQGIQKGIEQYKKAQKAKAREANKFKKKQQKQSIQNSEEQFVQDDVNNDNNAMIPWVLLVLSWLGFAVYVFILS